MGVNYWASHAGTDMWRNWDINIVEKDLELLAKNGVNTLRVFPNWRDFQPVEPVCSCGGVLEEYRLHGETLPENPYYLDETMMRHFSDFCKVAEKNGIKLIVGLLTGWMSGRLFIPPALFGKNLFSDSVALFFEQLYVKGFVEFMKAEKCIYAWDHVNECSCMGNAATREEAYSWTAAITNAIKACDNTRPIISGIHSLEVSGIWNIKDQAELSDMLVSHPYPYWVQHGQDAPLNSFRTLLGATAQTQYYASVGDKECLVEEIGTMGPMNCTDEIAADFLEINLWSNWANGTPGLLWWCAFDQSHLNASPYDRCSFERELGMVDKFGKPKKTLLTMKAFGEKLDKLNIELPKRDTDAVCVLGYDQDHWGIAYMSYLLAKQAGITLDFKFCDQKLPESNLYFLPSIKSKAVNKRCYEDLKQRVYNGAALYISEHDGNLTEFEEFTGLQVITARKTGKSGELHFGDDTLPYEKPCHFQLNPVHAEVLASEEDGTPAFTVANYGAGKVFYLNFPLEEMMLAKWDSFEDNYYKFYEYTANQAQMNKEVRKTNPNVGLTLHHGNNKTYGVLINYSAKPQKPEIIVKDNKNIGVLYGNIEEIEPFGTVIFEINK